jgi:hypothetical protein
LAQAIVEVHGRPGIFQQAGEFPTLTDPEYPLAHSARDFYKNGLRICCDSWWVD